MTDYHMQNNEQKTAFVALRRIWKIILIQTSPCIDRNPEKYVQSAPMFC